MIRKLLPVILTIGLVSACRSATGPEPLPRPAVITGCEKWMVEICWSWVLQGDQYVHTGSDGATATMNVLTFTSSEMHLHRIDYGKHNDLTAVYSGAVSGKSAAGTVTWNHSGNIRSGVWSAKW
jgi:hypothetical protein